MTTFFARATTPKGSGLICVRFWMTVVGFALATGATGCVAQVQPVAEDDRSVAQPIVDSDAAGAGDDAEGVVADPGDDTSPACPRKSCVLLPDRIP